MLELFSKKQYIKPELQVYELETVCMLNGSGDGKKDENPGGNYDQIGMGEGSTKEFD